MARSVAIAAALVGTALAGAALAQQSGPLDASLKALREAAPGVTWEPRDAAVGDVTCDGQIDVVAVGYEGRTVWIGLVPGSPAPTARDAIVGSFSVGRASEESFCATPVRLEFHPLTCENEDGPLPGCKRVDKCLGFVARDDACDGFHFFWNSERATITWWRR